MKHISPRTLRSGCITHESVPVRALAEREEVEVREHILKRVYDESPAENPSILGIQLKARLSGPCSLISNLSCLVEDHPVPMSHGQGTVFLPVSAKVIAVFSGIIIKLVLLLLLGLRLVGWRELLYKCTVG